MDRALVLEAFAPVEQLEEIVVPKGQRASEFVIGDDGLYWRARGFENEYRIGRQQAEQALRHVPGLSAAALKEWPTSLLIEPLNWWYQHGEGSVRVLVNGQGQVVSFTRRADHGIHSPTRILEAVEDALAEKEVAVESFTYDKVRVGLDQVSFAIVTTDRPAEVKVGDIVQSGIMVFGSPSGEAHTEVSPYLNRLVCTNGMISPVAMGRWGRRGGDGGSIYDWTREMTLQAWDSIDGELDALRHLTEVEVDGNVHTVMADLFERHHVPARMREQILEAAVEEHDGTMFGISQAFNRVANGVEDIAQLRHLLMITGDVAHQTERCSACMRVIN